MSCNEFLIVSVYRCCFSELQMERYKCLYCNTTSKSFSTIINHSVAFHKSSDLTIRWHNMYTFDIVCIFMLFVHFVHLLLQFCVNCFMSRIGSFVDDLGIGFDTFVLYYKSWANERRQASSDLWSCFPLWFFELLFVYVCCVAYTYSTSQYRLFKTE